jgi:predicted DCC family thiol-disulfide oxidoreductase YuxK
MSRHHLIVLLDGGCRICSQAGRMITRFDRQGVFILDDVSSLRKYVGDIDLLERLENMDTLVVIEGTKVFTHSDAILKIGTQLGGMFRIVSNCASHVPRSWRDSLYAFIARHRKKRQQCERR